MLTAREQERYRRHILLKEIGAQGQQKLKASRVLVVGAGGLGSVIIPYLSGAGVGRITIADDDHVDRTNLQRQTIYKDADIGAPKAQCAAAFARALNPDIEVVAHVARIGAEDAPLVAAHDLIVEGIDNFAGRFALNRLAIAARVPLISTMLGRFDGMATMFAPWRGNLPCLRCFMKEAPPRDTVLTCAEEGVAGPLAGIIGAWAALEALKELCGFGEPLAGRLLIIDGLSPSMRVARLPRDNECVDCGAIERG
jgi:adenylyltransferase/sulfurtransferase